MSKARQPASEPDFVPFADNATVRNIGELSFENGTTQIAIHGSLDLTRDRSGLERARRLKNLVDALVNALETTHLPDHVAEDSRPTTSVRNPFA